MQGTRALDMGHHWGWGTRKTQPASGVSRNPLEGDASETALQPDWESSIGQALPLWLTTIHLLLGEQTAYNLN